MEELENWYKSIASYKKLSLTEAKELKLKMEKTTDPNEKEKLREEMILGTLYKVYEFLKKTFIVDMQAINYDVSDLINATCLTWIEKVVDSDFLIDGEDIRYVFSPNFYSRLLDNLGINISLNARKNCVDKESFVRILEILLMKKKQGLQWDYEELKEEICKKYNYFIDIEEVFDTIYSIFSYMDDTAVDFNKVSIRQLTFLRSLLIDNVVMMKALRNVDVKDSHEDIEKLISDISMKSACDYILKKVNLTKKERQVLSTPLIFGQLSNSELAEILNINCNDVNQTTYRGLIKIRKYTIIKKVKNVLD